MWIENCLQLDEAVVQRSIWKAQVCPRRAAVCIPASLFVASHQDLNTSHGCPSYGEESKASLHSHCSLPRAGNGKERAAKAKFLTPDFKYSLPWKVWFWLFEIGVGAAYVRFLTYSVSLRQVFQLSWSAKRSKVTSLRPAEAPLRLWAEVDSSCVVAQGKKRSGGDCPTQSHPKTKLR